MGGVGVVGVAGGVDFGEVGGGPVGEVGEEGGEAPAEFADLVLDPRRHLRVVRAHDHAVAFELTQPLGHDGGASAHLLSPHDLVDVAKSSGVRRIVMLSSIGVATRPDSASHGGMMRTIEDAVRQSDLDWTILRPSGFHSNAYPWIETVRTQRMVAAPFADVGVPTIDPADIAEIAAAALRGNGHAGQIFELTGPALSTPRQKSEAIGTALGEPIRFIEQTRDEARTQMLQFMPEGVVETTLDALGEPTPAEQQISPAVERLLGRPPHTFADWTLRNLAAFK